MICGEKVRTSRIDSCVIAEQVGSGRRIVRRSMSGVHFTKRLKRRHALVPLHGLTLVCQGPTETSCTVRKMWVAGKICKGGQGNGKTIAIRKRKTFKQKFKATATCTHPDTMAACRGRHDRAQSRDGWTNAQIDAVVATPMFTSHRICGCSLRALFSS